MDFIHICCNVTCNPRSNRLDLHYIVKHSVRALLGLKPFKYLFFGQRSRC